MNTYQELFSPKKSMFKLNSVVKKQNAYISGNKSPMKQNWTVLNSPNIMVWWKITAERVIGLYCFEHGNVIGELYQIILINYKFLRFQSLRKHFFQ